MKQEHKKQFNSIFGWYGMGAILFGFAAVSFGVLRPFDVWYQILNSTGAVALIIHEGSQRDYAPTILNIVWLTIAVIGLLRIVF
ncbi:MAG: hypothetical protein Q8P82_03150 [bacterium]|nr:hypothetical protein [bacterium]